MRNFIGTFLLGLILLSACKKEDMLPEASRIFRPTLANAGLTSPSNYIEVKCLPSKEAVSYTVQISIDSFKTVAATMDVDSSYAIFRDLLYDQLYQVQVKGIATDTSKNSKFADLGAIKTSKFPTILISPTINDFSDASVKMSWRNEGAQVTSIKVYQADKTTLVKEVALNSTDVQNTYKVVTGLAGSTKYYLELYSGATLRGYDFYTTKAPFSGIVIDLREVSDRPSVLQDTLATIPSGSTVVLKKGLTYNISAATSISKTVTITSGTDLLVQEPATIYFTNNFVLGAGSAIDSISFVNVNLKGSDASAKYVFNNTNSATVDKIKFENVKAEMFRGLVRLQSGTVTINNFEVRNSIIDSIGNYGILAVGNANCKVQNILIKNSTISRAELVIDSRSQASNSVNIESCTFHRAPKGGSYIVDYNALAVANGISINNCIFSIGKSNAGNISPRGVRAAASTTINASGNYATSDYVNGGNPVTYEPYTRPSTDVFTDPLNLNFKIKDNSFPGRSTAGDPRWRL